MENSYTSWQVMDALMRQGYSAEQANAMYEAMGDQRKTADQIQSAYDAIGANGAELPTGRDGYQDSSLMPNLVEGTVGAAMLPMLEKRMPDKEGQSVRNKARFLGRMAGIGIPASLASTAATLATGNNFYDRATAPELVADIGGSIAGGFAGEALGSRLSRRHAGVTGRDLINNPKTQRVVEATKKAADKVSGTKAAENIKNLAQKTATAVPKSSMGTAAANTAKGLGRAALGRIAGTTLGSVLGPIGGIAGATLGGWLLPKLLGSGSKAVEDDDNTPRSENADWAVLGGTTAAAAGAAHPGTRKAALDQLQKKKDDWFANPLSEN